MGNIKNMGLLVLALTMMAILASGASALTSDSFQMNISLTKVYGDTVLVTVNQTEMGGTASLIDCNITIDGQGTNATGTTAVVLSNTSCNGAAAFGTSEDCNFTWDTTSMDDAANYTISAACVNASNTSETGTSNSIIVDNSVPTTPTIAYPTYDGQPIDDKDMTMNTTVNAQRTTGCYIHFIGGGLFPGNLKKYWVSNNDSTCVAYFGWGDMTDGTYRFVMSAYDGTNISANSTSREFIVEEGKRSSVATIAARMESAGYDYIELGGQKVSTDSILGGEEGSEGNMMPILLLLAALLVLIKKKNK